MAESQPEQQQYQQVKMVKLVSADGYLFQCSLEGVRRAKVLNTMIQDIGLNTDDTDSWDPIPLKQLEPATLGKVIQFLEYHKHEPEVLEAQIDGPKVLSQWDEHFLRIPQTELYQLISAANYLHIFPLLDRACQKVANMIRGKNATQIRRIYNITSDMTPAEEQQVVREGSWCYGL